jgi:hypothetical protein
MPTQKMVRTQVQLTDEQAQALKKLSAQTGLSTAELIRRALTPFLRDGLNGAEERRRRAMSIVGIGRSGHRDIAVNHDLYLDEDYEP